MGFFGGCQAHSGSEDPSEPFQIVGGGVIVCLLLVVLFDAGTRRGNTVREHGTGKRVLVFNRGILPVMILYLG